MCWQTVRSRVGGTEHKPKPYQAVGVNGCRSNLLTDHSCCLVAACRSTFRMTRELEKYGAASSCIAGREHIAYVVEGTCLQTAEVTEILMDAALNQRWVLGCVHRDGIQQVCV